MSYDFNRDMSQWADIEGAYHPAKAWLLSSADTWHKNPHYKGHPQPHPEDEVGENNQEPDEEPLPVTLGKYYEIMTLTATRDNIKQQLISYLGFTDPVSNATNQTIKEIVNENFKRLGVISP